MHMKITVELSRLILMTFLTVLIHALVPSLAAFAGTVPGAVMVVDAKAVETTPRVDKVTVQAGLLPRTGGSKSAGAYRLEVVGQNNEILYSETFNYPEYIQVPMEQPGLVNDSPGVVEPAEKEIGLVTPYFDNADHVRVIGPDKAASAPYAVEHPFNLDIPPEFLNKAASDYGTLHILIMASGYSNMNSFNTMAESVKSALLSREPFSSRSSDIDVHIHPNTAALGCAPGCSGIARLLCCSSSAVMSAAAASGYQYDEIIVLHNTATYSGGGYRDLGSYQTNSYSSYSANYHGSYTPVMSVHEFGHSFGDLCDEYSYGSEGYSYHTCVNCLASCEWWASITSGCNRGCDARPSFYRPEGSVMLSFNFANYNIPSREWSLEPRLEFFAGPASSSGGGDTNEEHLVPAVEAVVPENGRENVPIDHPISIRFNKAMDISTVQANLKIRKSSDSSPVAGRFQATKKSTAFFPSSDLGNQTSYTVVLGGGETKDAWGNRLGDDYEWSFTTGDRYMSIPVFNGWGIAIPGLLLMIAGMVCLKRNKS